MSFDYEIKQIIQDNAAIADALKLVWQVFEEFEAPDYSEEGVAEFQRFIDLHSVTKMIRENKLFLWACYDENSIIGVIATRPPCHMSLLFVDEKYHRRGIARKMYDTILDFYRTNSLHTEMTVNSSPYAIEAYHRLGFVNIDTEQTVNGIRFTPMKHTFG